METIKIQADVDDDHLIRIRLPKHIRTGRHEIVLVIDNDEPDQSTLNVMKYSGKITSWPDDPVDFQQRLRNEWD